MKRNQNLEILALVSAILWSTNSAQAQIRETAEQITVRAEALNNQGVDALEIGKFVEAIKLFQEAIYLRPAYTIAYGNLGAGFYHTGQSEDATTSLKKAIQLNSNYAEGYNMLGVIYAETGRNSEAVELLESV